MKKSESINSRRRESISRANFTDGFFSSSDSSLERDKIREVQPDVLNSSEKSVDEGQLRKINAEIQVKADEEI